MKKNTKFIYISELILLLYLIIFILRINFISIDIKSISAIVVLTFLLAILLLFFGFKKDNRFLKGTASRTVVSAMLTYMIIIYCLGIVMGFNSGYFSKNILVFLRNISPVLIMTVELELVRYLVIRNSFDNKRTIIIFTILSSLLNIFLELNLGAITTSESKFIFLSTVIIPIIAQEFLCSYMAYKIALLPCLIFKLVIKLYVFIIPIVPNLGDYVYSVANIILPFAIYTVLNKQVIWYEKEKENLNKKNRIIFTIPLVGLLIFLTILVSGIFKYKMIAIASNSMIPKYSRGDAVIYEKLKAESLSVGDIMAFESKGIIVTHRIVKIYKQNNKYYFITKGDNNNGEDAYRPSEDEVLGKVEYTIKYIGYPTVLISEYFRKE